MRTIVRTVVVAFVLLAMAAPARAHPARALPGRAIGTSTVRMLDRTRNVFRPGTITIDKGDRVRWLNRGDVSHTATFRRWDSGDVPPGGSWSHRFRHRGTFLYRCVIHPEMTGTVVVQ